MSLVIRALHRAPSPDLLNEEWMLLENTGPGVINAAGCALGVARGKGQRPSAIGTMTPGFVLQPGEKIRLVTGNSSKKAQGTPPTEEGVRNYHLFLREPVLAKAGSVVVLSLKNAELARATFAPEAESGMQPG